METKKDRFIRVATKRTNDILERIRILANCSNKSAYNYTDNEINKIFFEIINAAKDAKAKFRTSDKKEFKL